MFDTSQQRNDFCTPQHVRCCIILQDQVSQFALEKFTNCNDAMSQKTWFAMHIL